MRVVGEAELSPSRGYLFWIAPRRDYAPVVDLFARAKLMRALVFLPHASQWSALARDLAALGPGAPKVLPFSGFDAEIDEAVFGAAGTLASFFVRGFVQAAPRLTAQLPFDLARPLTTALADRLAGALRPVFALAQAAARHPALPVLHWPATGVDPEPGVAALPDAVARRLYRLAPLGERDRPPGLASADDPLFRAMPSYPPNEVARALDGAQVAVCGHLADQLYREACEELVAAMPAARRLALFPATLPADPELLAPLRRFEAQGRLTICPMVAKPSFRREEALAEGVEDMLHQAQARRPQPRIEVPMGELAPLAAQSFATLFPTLFESARDMAEGLAAHGAGLRAVIVMPGRVLASGVLVAAAQRRGARSFELQVGTISRSRRYPRPSADRLLAVDHASAAIFSRFHGMDEADVAVVGSLVLDRRLAALRGVPQELSREKAGLGDFARTGAPLVLLATQPLALDRAATLLSTVLEGLAAAGVSTLVVKTHPREGDGHEECYRRIAASYPQVAVQVLRGGDTATMLNAATVVLTYFSTTGIEAFALGRPVIAVNPFQERSPFDLGAMGIALRASNAAELAAGLGRVLAAADPQSYARDPRLSLLRDGGSASRVAALIEAEISRADGAGADIPEAETPAETPQTQSLQTRTRQAGSAAS